MFSHEIRQRVILVAFRLLLLIFFFPFISVFFCFPRVLEQLRGRAAPQDAAVGSHRNHHMLSGSQALQPAIQLALFKDEEEKRKEKKKKKEKTKRVSSSNIFLEYALGEESDQARPVFRPNCFAKTVL